MKLRDLLADVPLGGVRLDFEMEINDISDDPAQAGPGVAYVERPGEAGGAERALERGAAIVLCGRAVPGAVQVSDPRLTLARIAANWYCHPGRRLTLAAVAGSGDTELAAHLLRGMLEELDGVRTGMIGPDGGWIGPVRLPEGERVTGAVNVQRLLRRMADAGCTHVVLHMDLPALERLDFAPDPISVTALTGPVGSVQTLRALVEGSDTIVFNLDERGWEGYRSIIPNCAFTYSENKDAADLVAKNLRLFPGHVEFEALTVGQIRRIHLPTPGGYTLYHGLFVLACGLCLGRTLEEMARVLRSARGLQRRLEVLSVPAAYTVILDRAATPVALEQLLTCARELTAGRLVCLLSCPPEQSGGAALGSVAEQLADRLILTAPAGREGECGRAIRAVLTGTGSWRRPCTVEPRREQAISMALDAARPGDVIVLAGPGEGSDRQIVSRHVQVHHLRRERALPAGS